MGIYHIFRIAVLTVLLSHFFGIEAKSAFVFSFCYMAGNYLLNWVGEKMLAYKRTQEDGKAS